MKFTPSPDADNELRDAIRAQLEDAAEDIAEGAALLAPLGDPGRGAIHGNKTSYRTRTEADGRIIVGSDDPNAHIVEFGSVTSEEYAPMRRAIRALGHELNDLGPTGGKSGRIRSSAGRKPRTGGD